MQAVPHGGECCGVSHIFEFDLGPQYRRFDTDEERKSFLTATINDVVNEFENENLEYSEVTDEPLAKQAWGKKFGRLFEVCLNDQQMMVWAPILKEKGFRLAQRFKNDNSGNYVTLLTYVTKRPATKAPYKW